MWSNVIAQERVKNILKNIFRNKKISHAYIFYGDEGTGKDAAAVEFAKLINCDNPVNGTDACDKCKSCIEIDLFKSSLFKFITALPSGKNETDEDTNPLERLEKEDFQNYLFEISHKATDKYHKILIPRANDIRIISIRQMKKEIYLTGIVGKKKIFLISNADSMNLQSANALLKILEEPPGDSVIILTTSRVNSLLPTIVGRCQKIKFDKIPDKEISSHLNGKIKNLSTVENKFYTALADGSITKCNDILEKNFLELREKVLEMLSAILTGRYLKLGKTIDYVTGKKDKERIKQFIILMIIWFRDVINKSAGNDELLINKDKADRIENFVTNFECDSYKIINLLEESIRDIDGNIFPELLFFNLSNKIKSQIKKKQTSEV